MPQKKGDFCVCFCGEVFTCAKRTQKFCSRKCAIRAANTKSSIDPEARSRKAEYRRKYYQRPEVASLAKERSRAAWEKIKSDPEKHEKHKLYHRERSKKPGVMAKACERSLKSYKKRKGNPDFCNRRSKNERRRQRRQTSTSFFEAICKLSQLLKEKEKENERTDR